MISVSFYLGSCRDQVWLTLSQFETGPQLFKITCYCIMVRLFTFVITEVSFSVADRIPVLFERTIKSKVPKQLAPTLRSRSPDFESGKLLRCSPKSVIWFDQITY